MKVTAFKNYITLRLKILYLNAKFSFQLANVSVFQKWGNALSTLIYTLTYVVFVNILFSNVKLFAGYTRDEVLFMTLLGQIHFYIRNTWSSNNIGGLVESVSQGALDLILTKPLPHLFYITFKKLTFVEFIRDGFPPLIISAIIIDWSNIHTNFYLVLFGIIIFILGSITYHCYEFISALPVFWTGNPEAQVRNLATSWEDTSSIPLEGYTNWLRTIFIIFIPTLITVQMSVSVILQKSDPIFMLLVALAVTSVFVTLKIFLWNLALKNYTSASS